VKLLDFGLARRVETRRGRFTATAQGVIAGRWPTCRRSKRGKPVDARSDIFSFGSVLYEMVSGQRRSVERRRLPLGAVISREPAALGAEIRAISHR